MHFWRKCYVQQRSAECAACMRHLGGLSRQLYPGYPGTNRLSRSVSRPPPREGRERLETSCGKAREVNHVQGVIAQCTTMQHPLKILKSLSQLRNWQTAPSGCLGLDSVQMPHSQSVRCIRCYFQSILPHFHFAGRGRP